ncbi:PQQ-binding-like beta-propeller repeat protein [Promicromonospora citrea]|uniref:Pyrrolo-quinoline quinone repeat domain-containing protein n=1 Tax=Promicromonospora citrea TaxID=43677 RepID=A0A8H9GEQ0_9MICO|nr:PQQ-binding-like beta-propeller repeat protein [Promicromonospora citrea]NNH53669.1 PQQ-binding-like beta-propeller repeat protein [Promicromonospora citrea]GGM10651.1 hypothetical protein GCM10010102_03170 [Promicromonospora citrea]
MARDPDDGDAYVFDLVEDDAPTDAAGDAEPAADPDAGAGADPGVPPGAVPPSDPGRFRRLALPVAAVLAVALGTGVAVDGLRDDARRERMRDVPGGVADLSSPLAEDWAWSGVVGPGDSPTDAAVLGDVLAVRSDDGLVALDPASGAVAWTVPLRPDADCGPTASPRGADLSTPALVCVQGVGVEQEAVAVGPDGALAPPRALDLEDARRYGAAHTGPDGTVLRARRVGPVSDVDLGDATCTPAGECSGTIRAGRDLVLRAEDAVTGAERWTVTVPFRPADAVQCTATYDAAWGGSDSRLVLSGQLAPDTFGARVAPGLVELYGCGVQAAVTPDGAVLGTDVAPGLGGTGRLGAGYAVVRFDGVPRATLHAADGSLVGRLTGYPLAPRVSDGQGPGTVLAIDEPARRLRAYDADGAPRWDVVLQSGGQEFLAQVGDTAVVTTGAGTVRGLDLATGEERWLWDGSVDGEAGDGGYFGTASVLQALTDGETVLLVGEGGAGVARTQVALDAGTGEVVWHREGGAPQPRAGAGRGGPDVFGGLVAVDGHLLEVTSRGVRGLV